MNGRIVRPRFRTPILLNGTDLSKTPLGRMQHVQIINSVALLISPNPLDKQPQ
ncbi:hypothetical protein VCR4J2_550032 [Vibrio coralliirubri]|nr:hypothetical protein VCR4J2_550032 [Vibrio coralliirubri]